MKWLVGILLAVVTLYCTNPGPDRTEGALTGIMSVKVKLGFAITPAHLETVNYGLWTVTYLRDLPTKPDMAGAVGIMGMAFPVIEWEH